MAASAHQGGGSLPSPGGHDLAAENSKLRGNLGDALHALGQLLEAQGRAGMVDGDLADAISFARAELARLKAELRATKRNLGGL